MSHQLKPLQQWIFKLKWVVLATSMMVGLVMSELVWAGCTATGYCDINHNMYADEAACLAACVSAPSVPTYTLTLNTSGTGTGTVSGGGSYAEGTAVNLTAIGDPESVFVGWSEEGCDNTLILKENTTCTAKFEKVEPPNPNSPTASILPEYVSLAVQVAGSGSGTVSTGMGLSCKREDCEPNPKFPGELICQKNCEQTIKATQDVTLTQKADANSVFSGWGGHDDCVDGKVFMNGSKLCIAHFSRIYFLKVSTEGDGTVSGYGYYTQKSLIDCGSICQVPWEKGMRVVLEATPAAGMIFDGWTGDCSGQKQQLIVPFNNDMNCQANFIDPNALKKPIDQTITNFSPATSAVVGDQMTVTATGGDSGNPVTFASITPEICTVSAGTVHIITVGTCTLAADQAGNEDYNAAPQVTKTIIVTEPNKLDQVITQFSPATAATVNSSLVLTAVGGKSGNPVKFASATQDICTVEASDRVNFKTVGTCTLTADQAGNEQFNAASTVTVTVQVNSPVKQDQVITDFLPTVYASVTDQAKINGQATLAATGGPSGNPVIYTSKTPEKCTVSGNVVTFLAEGTCEVIANQAGNDEYHPAPQEIIKIEVASDQTTPPTEPAKFAGCTAPTIEEPLSVFNVSVCAKAPGQSEPLTYVREFKTLEDMQEFIKGIPDTEEFKQIKQVVNNTSTDPTSGVNSRINVIDNTFDVSFNSKDNAGAIHAQVDGEKFNIAFPNPQYGFKLDYSDPKGGVGTFQGQNATASIALLTQHLTEKAKRPKWVNDLIGSILRGVSSLTAGQDETTTDSTTTDEATSSSPPVAEDCSIEEENGVVIVSGSCDAKGQVFDKPVVVKSGTSLSNATFNNTVDNQGFLSNIKLGEKGEIKGGRLSGFVDSQGTVCDVEFVGNSFVGGTVCGKIQNESKVGACLKEVTAWTDTVITGCVEKKDQDITFVPDATGTTSATPATKKDQEITFYEALPTTFKVGSSTFIGVTASSGLVVDLVSDTPQVCKLFGSAVTFLTTGTCTVTANQAGNDGYNAAKPVSVNITVTKVDQTIQFTPPTSGEVGETLILGAGGGQSGNPVTFASDSPTICTLSENTLKLVAQGTCIVTANQAGNENYNEAKLVTVSIAVSMLTGIGPTGIGSSITQFTQFIQIFKKETQVVQGGDSMMVRVFNFMKIKTTVFGDIRFVDDSGISSDEKPRARARPTFDGNNLAFLSALGDSLEAAGYLRNDLVVGVDGTLFVANDTHGLLARPGETTAYTGIQSPGLYSPEEGFPYLVFADTDGQLKQTSFYPMLSPVIEQILNQELPTVTVESALDGTLKLTLEGGLFSFWQAGYVVTSGNETLEMNVVGDNLVISAGGQSQEFTPGIPMVDGTSMAFLEVVWKGAEELGFAPDNLMMTSFGSFVIVDANDNVIVSFKAGIPKVDSGTQPAGLYVPEGETPYVLFVDVDNQLKRSLLAPALSPDILATALEAFPNATFTLAPEGKVTVSFDGEEATEWQPAYVVTSGGETFEKQLVEGQLILSGGGQSQILLPVQP